MEIKYNLTGTERKALVKTVSNIIGEKFKYLGAPSFAYQIGDDCTVTSDGTLKIQTTPTMIKLSIYLKSCMSADMKPRMMKMLILQTQIKILKVKQ